MYATVAVASNQACTAEVNQEVKLSDMRSVWLRRQAGQGLAEYALILALIAVLAIAAITFMGGSINTMLSDLGNSM
jgi:pilus assembly protein Flp/PilA